MFAVIVVSSLFALVSSFPAGPPTSACQSMVPTGHGVDPQTSPAPYTITMNTTSYSANSVIEVNIQATSGAFRGVFVQARRRCGDMDTAVGTFSLEQGETYLQLLSCNGPSSAVAHSNNADTTNKTFYWRAPAQTQGDLYFRGTFVQTRPVFWVGVTSPALQDSTNPGATCGCSRTKGLHSILLFSVIFLFQRTMKN